MRYLCDGGLTNFKHAKVAEYKNEYYARAEKVIPERNLGLFTSSYAGYCEKGDRGHPPFTTYGDHKDFIDFITHTSEFATLEVLEMPEQIA